MQSEQSAHLHYCSVLRFKSYESRRYSKELDRLYGDNNEISQLSAVLRC